MRRVLLIKGIKRDKSRLCISQVIYIFFYIKNILDPSKDFMEQLQQGFNDITPKAGIESVTD